MSHCEQLSARFWSDSYILLRLGTLTVKEKEQHSMTNIWMETSYMHKGATSFVGR